MIPSSSDVIHQITIDRLAAAEANRLARFSRQERRSARQALRRRNRDDQT